MGFTHSHLVRKWTLKILTKLAGNGWVFVYEVSGCGLESHCGLLKFRYRTSFEQELPWHSGNQGFHSREGMGEGGRVEDGFKPPPPCDTPPPSPIPHLKMKSPNWKANPPIEKWISLPGNDSQKKTLKNRKLSLILVFQS